jgi:aminoglycoside phosphotransferase (APT) family kinase protein
LVEAADSSVGKQQAESLAPDWFTERVAITDTALVVAIVRCRTSGRRRVVKMPCSGQGADSLRRQTEVLTALHRDERLAGWLDVVPRPRTYGEIAGRGFWVEDALDGRPVPAKALRSAEGGAILAAATRLIEELHSRTSTNWTVGGKEVAEWIDRPLRRLETFYTGRPRHDDHLVGLQRLGVDLSTELADRRVRLSWIHGDFWTGNLLVRGPAVTGIVDWDRAEPHQLPLHDLLHLAVFARRVRDGCELGDVVIRALRDGLVDAIGISSSQLDVWLDGVPPRTAILLLWLRHISLFIESEGHGDNRDWVRRNVDNVLARC